MNEKIEANKKLSGVCGVFCQSCMVYIGTREEPERLKWLAQRLNCTVDEMKCNGCKSDKRSLHCQDCTFIFCAKSKGVEFCAECKEYPCEDFIKFQKEKPHRAELFGGNEKIKDQGYEKWFEGMLNDYSCAKCGIINSAYDLKCRRCQTSPSSDFFQRHENKITEYLKKISTK